MHCTQYQLENSGALRQDWPRIPLPADRELLQSSADLGRQIASLLDPETPVPGVTSGTILPELQAIAPIQQVGGGQLDPNRDLALTAGWGHHGKNNITMPGRGKIVPRDYHPPELAALADAISQLGPTTVDVYLNDTAYWCNIPQRVWDYTIGGYQVIKKWLSYREQPLLGRSLTVAEARYITEVARRIAAILLLEPQLDANYNAVKANLYQWPQP